MQTRNYKQFEVGFALHEERAALLFRLDDTNDGHGEKGTKLAYRFAIMTARQTDKKAAAAELKKWLDEHADDEFPSKAAGTEFVMVPWPNIDKKPLESWVQFSDRLTFALREATAWLSPEQKKAEKDLDEYFSN